MNANESNSVLPAQSFPFYTIQPAEGAPSQAALPGVTAYGCREASIELYDVCLRTAALCKKLEEHAAFTVALGQDLRLELMTTALLAQQALDHARRES